MAAAAGVSTSQLGVAADKDTFTFPAQDGGSEERSLDGKTQDQLKEMCRQYGLGVSGNKTVLKTRLEDFSVKFCNDPASCDLKPVNRRSHKGPRDGVKKSQAKQSATRRAAIIDTGRVTERSKDNRPSDEIKDLLSWARRTQARLPYRPPTETMQPQSVTVPESTQPETVPVPQVSSQGSLSDRSLQDRMQSMENQLAVITTAVTTGFRPGAYQSSVPASASTPFPAYPDGLANDGKYDFLPGDSETDNLLFDIPSDASRSYPSDSQNLHISQLFAAVPPLQIQADIPHPLSSTSAPSKPIASLPVPAKAAADGPTRSIKLGDGTVVSITAEEVKKLSVPATSFAEDIERLNQMWDDTSPHWKEDSVVKIDGHSIALVYWPGLFKKTGLWSAHKSNWTEWKFLIENYRLGTPDEFWTAFRTQDGGKMSYTAICGQLRHNRKNSDEELAKRARLEYGENFVVKFSYRCSKTNSRKVMTKPSAIAKEYKRLSTL